MLKFPVTKPILTSDLLCVNKVLKPESCFLHKKVHQNPFLLALVKDNTWYLCRDDPSLETVDLSSVGC